MERLSRYLPLFTVLWGLLHVPEAKAIQTLLSFPEGPPLAGEEIPIEIVVYQDDERLPGIAPELQVEAGKIIGHEGETQPGTWAYRYLAPAEAGAVPLQVQAGGQSWSHIIPVSDELPPGLDSGPIQTGRAAQKTPMKFEITGLDPSDLPFLQVGAPEGEVVSIDWTESGAIVQWKPGPEPFPRAIPLGFRDGRQPGSAPAWTVAFLRSYPSIPIRTEPGTRVELTISGRKYGPFQADASGQAVAQVEVRPGEDVADVTLRDSLDNTQRSSLTLGGNPSPGIVAIAEGVGVAGDKLPVVHVFAIRPDGRAWRGTTPSCQTSLGQSLNSVPAGAGAWRYTLPAVPEGAFFDIRVDCMLGTQARTSIRVPVDPPTASRLRLRAYPAELAADRPVAQVEAFLENASGERVPADGIQISADLGEIELLADESGPAAARAIYSGASAVAAGIDTIRADWYLPPGEGGAWSLESAVSCPVEAEHCRVQARARDRIGRPLSGVEVRFEAGNESLEALTDDRGWASMSLKRLALGQPFSCVIRAGTVERELVVFPGEEYGPDSEAPDLWSMFDVRFRAGLVQNVFLNAEPNPMVAGRDVNARVQVKLVDGDGNPVEDPTLQIDATEGVLTRPRLRGGVYEATWAPRPGMARGTVQITATSGAGLFVDTATELEVSPRPIRSGVSMEGGWIWGASGISSPWLGASLDSRTSLTSRPIFGRIDVGTYRIASSTTDDQTGQEVKMELGLVPVGFGLLTRQERGRWSTWLGGSLRLVPYRVKLDFGDELTLDQAGMAPPGGCLFAGVGLRLLSAELYSQVSYELMSLPGDEVGFAGPVGGFSVRSGYRVLF